MIEPATDIGIHGPSEPFMRVAFAGDAAVRGVFSGPCFEWRDPARPTDGSYYTIYRGPGPGRAGGFQIRVAEGSTPSAPDLLAERRRDREVLELKRSIKLLLWRCRGGEWGTLCRAHRKEAQWTGTVYSLLPDSDPRRRMERARG